MSCHFNLKNSQFFFQAFLCLSIGGTLFHGYFFAFHLLNIVNNNQLLSGVIKAVTQNGNYELSNEYTEKVLNHK